MTYVRIWQWDQKGRFGLPRRGPRKTVLREDWLDWDNRRRFHRHITGDASLKRPLTEDELAERGIVE